MREESLCVGLQSLRMVESYESAGTTARHETIDKLYQDDRFEHDVSLYQEDRFEHDVSQFPLA